MELASAAEEAVIPTRITASEHSGSWEILEIWNIWGLVMGRLIDELDRSRAEMESLRETQLAAAEKLRGIYGRMIDQALDSETEKQRMIDPGETNYADHPVSLGGRRSERANDGSLWKPRDALIDLLRKIDAGADVTDLIVCWRQRNKDGVWTGNFRSACADGIVAQGLLARTLYSMNT